jgi:hypothetical protein
VNAVFEWLKMGIDDRRYRCRIDIAQVVVHENIAKAKDLAPRYALTACLQGFRQVLCCLREGVCRLRSVASYRTSSARRSPRAWIRRILAMASRMCCAYGCQGLFTNRRPPA